MNAQQYAVLYVFDVKSGSEAVFEAAWKSVTEAIQSESGSGGSRLHKSQNGTYWAHALWPSRAALTTAGSGGGSAGRAWQYHHWRGPRARFVQDHRLPGARGHSRCAEREPRQKPVHKRRQ